jgi:aspartyl-tRNA(Asn)/glutamyl-tRNA(Gln) amidotransferase subunit A
MDAATDSIPPQTARGAGLCRNLHWLAIGRLQPRELSEVHLDAIARLNPRLNAFLDVRPGLVREQAAAAANRRHDGLIGRLDGIPIAVKDNLDVAGLPTTAGLASRKSRIAQLDAHAVSRLRASGAVLIGKTNLDEGALGASTNNPHFGPTHNPHRHGYTAGGSSGGSAAAVAAGLAVAALGSDTLGSVRIPAS